MARYRAIWAAMIGSSACATLEESFGTAKKSLRRKRVRQKRQADLSRLRATARRPPHARDISPLKLAVHDIRPCQTSQKITLAHIAAAAAAMTAVAIHPINRRPSWMGNLPMILGLAVMCIMMIMMGTATTPLITALQ